MNEGRHYRLSPDAVKLIVMLAIFNWALFTVARNVVLDYSVLYTAGALAYKNPSHLYHLQTQAEFQRTALGANAPLPFCHLAYESILFIPLALLPYKISLWIWRAACLVMLLVASKLLARVFHFVTWQLLLFAMAFLAIPVAIVQGQDSLLSLLLLSISFSCLTHERHLGAGAILALGLFKPHLVLPVAIFLAWRCGRKFALGFSLSGAVLVFISTALTGLRGWLEFAHLIRIAGSAEGLTIGADGESMPNIRGLVTSLHFAPRATSALALIMTVLVLAFTTWKLYNEVLPVRVLPPVVATALLVCYNLNLHDVSLLLVPMLAALVPPTTVSAQIWMGACFTLPFLVLSGLAPLAALAIGAGVYLLVDDKVPAFNAAGA